MGERKFGGILAASAAALALSISPSAKAASFTPGDLVVLSYGGPGTSITQGAATPLTLVEFSPLGGARQLSFQLPTTDGSGAANNLGVVGEYGSSSEGNIELSGNGEYLTFAGYSATAAAKGIQLTTADDNGDPSDVGEGYSHSTIPLAQSADTDVPRVFVTITANETVNSSTSLTDVYNLNNARGAYSTNGSSFYISGQGQSTADQGTFLVSSGPGNTPVGIATSHDTRFTTAFNGNLYYSEDTGGSKTGVFEFSGLPTTSGQSVTQLFTATNGKSGSSEIDYSPEGFFFANSTTLYVADTGIPKSGKTGDGGIQKWSLSGGVWSLDYTLTETGGDWLTPTAAVSAKSGESGFEALTGQVIGNNVDLYAVSYTAGDDNPNGLYSITDSLSATTLPGSESFDEIETANGDGGENFKGVSFAPTPVPEPASFALLGLAGATLLARRPKRSPIS
jgi:hypothetical protein